jgi:Ala-tRNA(Pro) deacylase
VESHAAEAKLFSFLDELGIETTTVRHAPVFTVEEAQIARASTGGMAGGHAKSLFIRDKKKRRALVMVEENTRVDLKSLAPKVALSRVSFGSSDSLKSMLGVIPGSVTPFALVNAQVAKGSDPTITVALDKNLMAKSPLWFHPLHNAATTAISPDDLRTFIQACGYEPIEVDLTQDLDPAN